MGCKEIGRFICAYMIAKDRGFHIGHVDVSCEHCLDGFLSDFGGVVIYKKRFKTVPAWPRMSPIFERIGKDWIEGVHPLCGAKPVQPAQVRPNSPK